MMAFFPEDIDSVLEYDKLIQIATEYCKGVPGRELLNNISFSTDLAVIESQLDETSEYLNALQASDALPLENYSEIRNFTRFLNIHDYSLDLEQIVDLKIVLGLNKQLAAWAASDAHTTNYPLLSNQIKQTNYDDRYLIKINKIVDDQGNIKSTASEQLIKIRKAIGVKKNELERAFDQIAATYKSKNQLTDTVESFRNGRRVLSVPVEFKRQIPGIIHDESATGKTVFIEPEPMIAINNDLSVLEHAEIREIARIIKQLCNDLSEGQNDFDAYLMLVAHLDFVGAKAQLALLYNGERPKVLPTPQIKLYKAFHPLLLLKNNKLGKKTIPFDLLFREGERILIISGPNAGGKSVLMKAVGLLQLMIQRGLLVPAFNESEFGIFTKIFADIGDKQSLEEDLSTYSSHLKSMKYFTDHVDARTLLLIDEFGSGTDPDVGGAIAESVLRYLNQKKAHGVVTTHYSVLKLFAHNEPGLVNGSMLFDTTHLLPTYRFKLGSPGSSFAFELARNNGIHKAILHRSEQKLGSKKYKVDRLLNDLQNEKHQLENELKDVQAKEKQLDKLIATYNQQSRDFEFKRMKLRQEIKEHQLSVNAKQNDFLDERIKEISRENNLDKIKALAFQKKKEREQLSGQIVELKDQLKEPNKNEIIKSLEVGDYVKLISSGTPGHVTEILKDQAKVNVGTMTVIVPISQISIEREPQDLRRQKAVKLDMVTTPQMAKNKIDLRGLRRDEALGQLEEFIDQAIIAGKSFVEILHGKGDGVLKLAVKHKIREYNLKMEITHPAPEYGGDGITIVTIG